MDFAEQNPRAGTLARPYGSFLTFSGRFLRKASFFCAGPPKGKKRNDPWRFRQQSSRVISVQSWYLTSLFTSLSIGSDIGIQNGK
jgi:hypothetical protein